MPHPIIVPLDGSELAESAVPRAAAIARATKSPLHIVRVHVPVLAYAAAESPVAIPDPIWDAKVRDGAQQWLVQKAAALVAELDMPVTCELRIGSPAEEIAVAATERGAQFIVCTTHGHGGWAAQWIGSVTDAVIRRSACPVVAMSEGAIAAPATIRRILVTLDGSRTAAAILPHVRALATATGAAVDLYRVVAPPWTGDVLNAVQSGRVDRFGIDPAADIAKTELDRVAQAFIYAGVHATATVEVASNPTRAILDRIADAKPDLVAMSTHGRGLSRLFMGSVADKVLRAGGRPVLCWRSPHALQDEPETERMFATSVSGPAA